MKLYFLATKGIGNNDVTIVTEKMLFNMVLESLKYQPHYAYPMPELMFNAIVIMANGEENYVQSFLLGEEKKYICKSMAKVKSIKKGEILRELNFHKYEIKLLKEQMDCIKDMNIKINQQ